MLNDYFDLGAIWKFFTGRVLPVYDSANYEGKFKFCCYAVVLLSSIVRLMLASEGFAAYVRLSYMSKEVLTLRLLFFAPLVCNGKALDC